MEENNRYASFIIEDIHKNVIEQSCNHELLNNVCVNDKPDAPLDVTPVYFSRKVLVKYLNDTESYSVNDGEIYFKQEGFHLQVDIDMPEWVAVLLVDLAYLNYNEQLYWRSFNLSPVDKHISQAAYTRWFDGNFAKSSAPDMILIQKYKDFYTIWEKYVGWPLFLEDPENKKANLYSLHTLSNANNSKEFYEQILVFTKVFIDSLNVKQFPKSNEPGSINRFSAYLNQFSFQVTGVVEFLRMVQRLRSSTSAHTGKIETKVEDYFKMKQYPYGSILANIFMAMTEVLNTLMLASCRISDYNHSNPLK